ncbi:MAG: TolC family protein [Syntrophobacteraceae bacterium]
MKGVRAIGHSCPEKIFLTLCLVVLALLVGPIGGARAEDSPLAENAALTAIQGQMDFKQCMRVALERSPYFTSSSLDISLKRLDESDARYALYPTLSVHTSYFLNNASILNPNQQPFSIGFYTNPYNPIASYFTLKASKLITRMAIYGHLQVISASIQRLGNLFLELDSLGRTAAFQDEIIEIDLKDLAYAKNRVKSESASPLDVRMAEQELQLAQLEKDRITASQAARMDEVKTVIGLKAEDRLELDLGGVRQQVLNAFDPAAVTFEQVRSNSYDLKIQSLKKELQKLNVTLAYARFLPTVNLVVQSGDPLNAGTTGEYYAYINADMPLWDGLKRVHDVTRQKDVLSQYNAEERTKDLDLDTAWTNARRRLVEADAALNMARSQEELARLQKKQSEISYREGRLTMSQYLAESKRSIQVQWNSEQKELEYLEADLALYALSGELSRRFVAPDSF